ncbi:MAG: tyrosine-protein phosphatase [Candidatus Neomarinimicrobiota bacterium]
MIDFHNHILPRLDDGSSSIETTLNMLRRAEEQGITEIVNTTHYKHPKMLDKEINYNIVKDNMINIEKLISQNGINIKLHAGAETFFHEDLLKLVDDKLATFCNGKYMLIEFLTNFLPPNHRQVLYELKMRGITPIIAHPERYKDVQENVGLVANWLESGCIVQIDAGSPLGYFGMNAKRTSEIIIKNQWCQIIGSDAHDDKKRNFCLYDSLKYVRGLIGDCANKLVYENPKSVIEGRSIDINVNYQNLYEENLLSIIKSKLNIS